MGFGGSHQSARFLALQNECGNFSRSYGRDKRIKYIESCFGNYSKPYSIIRDESRHPKNTKRK